MSEKDYIGRLFQGCNIVVCCGTSGSGKSTIALSLGLLAINHGRKPLIFTTVPSTGLFPFKELKPFIKEIDAPSSLNRFLKNLCSDAEIYKGLLKNSLYCSIATAFSGSKEYAILLELFFEWERGKYDFYIVDLPFSENPYIILESQAKISRVFESNALKWLIPEGSKTTTPYMIRKGGHTLITKIISRLSGRNLLDELRDFFIHFKGISDKFLDAFKKADMIIKSPKITSYVVVMNPCQEAVHITRWILRRLHRDGIFPSLLILNKIRASSERDIKDMRATSRDQRLPIISEEVHIIEGMRQLIDKNTKIMCIPYFPSPLKDIEALMRIVHWIDPFLKDN